MRAGPPKAELPTSAAAAGGGEGPLNRPKEMGRTHLHQAVAAGRNLRHLNAAGAVELRLRRFSTGPDGFIHHSILPSYFFQEGLFPLPIPKLEDTLRRYLRSLQSLVTPAAFARTSALAGALGGEPGAALQARLLASAAAKPHTSYISEAWFDAYLTNRAPLPLNLNPQLTWRDDPRPTMQAQAARAANIAHAAARFHLTLAAGALEPEVYHLKCARVFRCAPLPPFHALLPPLRPPQPPPTPPPPLPPRCAGPTYPATPPSKRR